MKKWMAGIVALSVLFGNANAVFASPEYDSYLIQSQLFDNEEVIIEYEEWPSDEASDSDDEWYPDEQRDADDEWYTEEDSETEEESAEDQLTREEEIDAAEIISKIIKPTMTEYQKALAIHDYIVFHTRYDTENYKKNTIPSESYRAIGVYRYNIAVCAGYAKAYEQLAKLAGLEAIYVVGVAQNESHAWNKVKIDGNWYNVDVTWNDNDNNGSSINHDYLFVPDWVIGVNHKEDENMIYPSATTLLTKSESEHSNLITEKRILKKDNLVYFLDQYELKIFDSTTMNLINKFSTQGAQLVDWNQQICFIQTWSETLNCLVNNNKIVEYQTIYKLMNLEVMNNRLFATKYFNVIEIDPKTKKQKMILRDAVLLGTKGGYLYYQTYENKKEQLGRININQAGYPKQVLWNGLNASFTRTKNGGVTWYTSANNFHIFRDQILWVEAESLKVYSMKFSNLNSTKRPVIKTIPNLQLKHHDSFIAFGDSIRVKNKNGGWYIYQRAKIS